MSDAQPGEHPPSCHGADKRDAADSPRPRGDGAAVPTCGRRAAASPSREALSTSQCPVGRVAPRGFSAAGQLEAVVRTSVIRVEGETIHLNIPLADAIGFAMGYTDHG